MMVDWVSGIVEASGWYQEGEEIPPLYDTGHFLRISRHGEVEQKSASSVLVEGSHDSRLMVRSPRGHDLYISGNVVKHIQGHNLFGSDDPLGLFFEAGARVRQAVGLFPSPGTWESCAFRGPRFTRLDLTRSYRFPTGQEANAWIRQVAASARSKHGGAVMESGTAYLGKRSERWGFKIYHKGDEIHARGKFHRLVSFLGAERRALQEWADGVVRFELTLRSKELVKWDMRATEPREIWESYYDRITLNQNWRMTDMKADLMEEQLSPLLKGVLSMWRLGEDLRKVYPKPTFYRHRRALLEAVGVDISEPPADVQPLPAAPEVRPVLDPRGWDPEPLEAYLFRPDPTLPLRYRSGGA